MPLRHRCPRPSQRRRSPALQALLLLALAPLLLSSCRDSVEPSSTGPAANSAGSPQEKGQQVLRLGAIPDQKPEVLNRLYPLVAEELATQLGVKVVYVPVVDYGAAVSAFRRGDLDLVWFGGLSGVQARLQTPGATVIAQRDIDARFYTLFIASEGSGLQPFEKVEDLSRLRGKRFTFGSPTSTSGTLMPLYYLGQAGMSPSDFAGGTAGYSNSHDTTIALVQSGTYDAGSVNEQVWKSNIAEGKADPSRVKVIWRTPPYHDYHWIARPDLDQRFGTGFVSRVRKEILGWTPEDPEQQKILEIFGAERFIEADDGDYSRIEEIGRRIGKIR